MHLPDTSPVFAALGAIAANFMVGPPVWLMLISPPSSGKTQIINSCLNLPHCREAGQCKNSSAFLTYDKDRGLGGLLSEPLRDKEGFEIGGIGEFGILLYTEFSVILGMNQEQRDEVIGIHRQIFDGRLSRQYGANGGRVLEWEGKCGALGAVTGAIDNNPLSADLGERWIYYRFPPSDLKAQARAVLNPRELDPQDRNAQLNAAIHDVFMESGIRQKESRREFKEKEDGKFTLLSTVACQLRGTVRRDRYTKDILDTPQIEGSGRMTNELASLFLGLEKIGLVDNWSWKIVRKVAVDSAPALRTEILGKILHLEYLKEEATTQNICGMLKVSRRTTERYLEDMEKLDIMKREDHVWVLAPDVKTVMLEMQADL